MGRGFFAGILWGAVIGAVTLALASQLTERRELVAAQPQRAEVEIPGGSEFNQARPETDPVLPATDAPPAAAAPVAVAEPEPSAPPAPADPAPAAPETVAVAPATVALPEAPETAAVAAPVAEAPAAAGAAPAAAEAPAPDVEVAALPELSPVEAPVAVTQPPAPGAEAAAPTAPAVAARAPSPAAPVSVPVAPALPPVVLPGAITPPVVPNVGDSRVALSAPAVAAPVSGAAVAPPPAPADAPPATAVAAPVAPRAEPEIATAPAAPETPPDAAPAVAPPAEPDVAAEPPVSAPAEPEVAATPAAPQPAPAAGDAAPIPGFANAEGVRVNRLPRIGVEEPAADMPAAEAVEEVPMDEDAPALVRNAVAFVNPDLRPVVAIVLLHDRPLAPGAETGRDLAIPVSFAVDAGLVEAGTIADAYRAAGREILLVPTLPPGAAAADVEVALQVNLDVVPEAVALMDLPAGGFQSERVAVAQVVSAITATGHGLVTFPRGLNMAEQMAARAGVPTRAVFRMLEPGDTDAALRTLDQAAFRARQEGAVILVGEAEPATVEAIRRWAEANPDGEILLAPVSAALGAE